MLSAEGKSLPRATKFFRLEHAFPYFREWGAGKACQKKILPPAWNAFSRGGDYFLSNPQGLALPVHRFRKFLCIIQIKKGIIMTSYIFPLHRVGAKGKRYGRAGVSSFLQASSHGRVAGLWLRAGLRGFGWPSFDGPPYPLQAISARILSNGP